MKKLFLLLSAILITNVAFAQSKAYKKAIESFKINYNAGDYEEIFNSFSYAMQQGLPLEKTISFLTGLKKQVGKIEQKKFIDFQKGHARYKTKFENDVLWVNISLNKKNKINRLLIKPYIKVSAINGLKGYPDKIAQLTFSETKAFPNNTQLSIAVVKGGEVNYYGIIKKHDTIHPKENHNKVFEIGSITKVFTSTVLASLVKDNKVELKENINQYYSFPFNDSIKITFLQLANHTSGLPTLPGNFNPSDFLNPYKNYDEEKLKAYLKKGIHLNNKPGKVHKYSNLGVGLLGYTLGLSQNTTFQNLLQKRVLDKYNMNNTYVSSKNLSDQLLVKGRNKKGEITPNWDLGVLFAAGGMLSTTSDLVKFMKAQFNPSHKELALTREATFSINEKMEIGLGWFIKNTKNGDKLYWHDGGTGGYTSFMVFNPKNKTGIIILSNVSAFNLKTRNITSLGFQLMGHINK